MIEKPLATVVVVTTHSVRIAAANSKLDVVIVGDSVLMASSSVICTNIYSERFEGVFWIFFIWRKRRRCRWQLFIGESCQSVGTILLAKHAVCDGHLSCLQYFRLVFVYMLSIHLHPLMLTYFLKQFTLKTILSPDQNGEYTTDVLGAPYPSGVLLLLDQLPHWRWR